MLPIELVIKERPEMSLWDRSRFKPMAAVWDEGSPWFADPWGAVLPHLVTQETVICIYRSKTSLFRGVSAARPAGRTKPLQLQCPGASMDLPRSVPCAGSMSTSWETSLQGRGNQKPDLSRGDTQAHSSSEGKCKDLCQV